MLYNFEGEYCYEDASMRLKLFHRIVYAMARKTSRSCTRNCMSWREKQAVAVLASVCHGEKNKP